MASTFTLQQLDYFTLDFYKCDSWLVLCPRQLSCIEILSSSSNSFNKNRSGSLEEPGNVIATRATDKSVYSFSEFFQTVTSISISF